MRIIAPIEITDAILTSSTVAENDYASWASGTAYTTGQKVIRTTTHKIYEALQNSTGKTPESEPTYWLDLGATNRWKMFDQKVGTKTTATTSMTIELHPGEPITSIVLLETDAYQVQVQVTDPVDGVVYDKTTILQQELSYADWWYYFFDPVYRATSVTYYDIPGVTTFEDLPSYYDATTTITISGETDETVECGVCILGKLHRFAEAVKYGATVWIQDYSRKDVDDWGNVSITERGYAKRASFEFMCPSRMVDLLQRTLAGLRAKPAVYIGGDDYESLYIYGFYKDFNIVISYPNFADCFMEVESLIGVYNA